MSEVERGKRGGSRATDPALKPSSIIGAALHTTIVASAAVAVISFLFLHAYAYRVGFMGNVMYQAVWLTNACLGPGADPLDVLGQSPLCGIAIPYRWILAAAVLVIAAALIAQHWLRHRADLRPSCQYHDRQVPAPESMPDNVSATLEAGPDGVSSQPEPVPDN